MADSICPSTAAPEGQPTGPPWRASRRRCIAAAPSRRLWAKSWTSAASAGFWQRWRTKSQVTRNSSMSIRAKPLSPSCSSRPAALRASIWIGMATPWIRARLASLDEDAADELVQFCALETTPAGVQVAQAHRPEVRLEELFARTPERNDAYRAILRAASEPKSFAEIEALLGKQLSLPSLNGKSGCLCIPARWWRTWKRPAAWCGTRPGAPPRPERASRPQTKGASNGGTEVELRKARPHGAEGAGHRLGLGRLSRGG